MQFERTMRFSDGRVDREIITLPTGPWDGPTMRMYQLGYCLADKVTIEYRRLADR
jgi:hypothetical protein